jgi:catechol 2,3-dioxygenase-like lactoylglutathione lyase family enzyme
MLDHISLGVTDLERSRRFYDAALRPVGPVRTVDFQKRGSDYGAMAGQLGVEFTITLETGVSPLRGMHVCFRAPNRASVRAFHGAALTAGGHEDGGPACARSIIPTTTRPLSSIRTGTASRRSVTRRNKP